MYILEKRWRYDVLCRRKTCFDPKFLRLMFILSYITYYNIHAGRKRPEGYISQDKALLTIIPYSQLFAIKYMKDHAWDGWRTSWSRGVGTERQRSRSPGNCFIQKLLTQEQVQNQGWAGTQGTWLWPWAAMVKWLRFSCHLFFFHQEVKNITKYKTSSIPSQE